MSLNNIPSQLDPTAHFRYSLFPVHLRHLVRYSKNADINGNLVFVLCYFTTGRLGTDFIVKEKEVYARKRSLM